MTILNQSHDERAYSFDLKLGGDPQELDSDIARQSKPNRYVMSPADPLGRAASVSEDREAESGLESENEVHSGSDSDQNEATERKTKRARKSKSNEKAPRKRYVRGKQGGLKGIMKMPIEVFTEIAYHITPADLITLVRTNKFFRSMLLRRSAIRIWQCAQENVPGLPPHPTGMTEPQYAALMFSKCCTLCGASATSRPDPWLRLRLCSSCRDTKLQLAPYGSIGLAKCTYVAVSWHAKPQKSRSRNVLQDGYYIIEEYERANKSRAEFQGKGDRKGLAEWESARIAHLKTQREEAEELWKYITTTEKSREHELDGIKDARSDQINGKLRALGWEDKYLEFWPGPKSREWNSLVRAPRPLTERTWANILPKLTPLLEENRIRVDEREKESRKSKRYEKISQLLDKLGQEMYPFLAISKKLDLKLPVREDIYFEHRHSIANPFPSISIVIKWDVISDIYEGEYSVDQVEEYFNQRRGDIVEKVSKWREDVEGKLVGLYRLGSGEAEELKSIVTAGGSTDTTESLSSHLKFLLRADTIFVARDQKTSSQTVDQEYGSPARGTHFPTILCRVQLSSSYPNLDLEKFTRHTGAEKIAKALLKDMDMPDVAYAELNRDTSVFACGRCENLTSTGWEGLLNHYHVKLQQWADDQLTVSKCYTTRHPVAFLNPHELQSERATQPLASLLSSDDIKAIKPLDYDRTGYLWCLMCSGARLYHSHAHSSMERLLGHMNTTHGIAAQPVLSIHYTDSRLISSAQPGCIREWQERWDAHYDASLKAIPADSQPQSSE